MAEPTFQLFSSLRYDPLLLSSKTNTESWPSILRPSTGSPFYMLTYHRDRMLQAAQHFGWVEAAAKVEGAEGLGRLIEALNKAIDSSTATKPLRVKTLLDHFGNITVETSPATDVSMENLFPARIPPPRNTLPVRASPLTGGAMTLGPRDTLHGDSHYEVVVDVARTTPTPYTSFKTTSRDMYDGAREKAGIQNPAQKKEVLIVSSRDGAIMEGSLTSVYFWRGEKWVTPDWKSGGQVGTTRRWALEKQ